MKVYIAGKITGDPNYRKKFKDKETELLEEGHTVMNPSILPDGFEHHEYMQICYSMIDVCEAVFFLDDWADSIGAGLEFLYARKNNKKIGHEVTLNLESFKDV